MKFTVETSSGLPSANLSFEIEVPDAAGREYTTVVTSLIAAAVAKGGELLIKAENDSDLSAFLTEGRAIAAKLAAL